MKKLHVFLFSIIIALLSSSFTYIAFSGKRNKLNAETASDYNGMPVIPASPAKTFRIERMQGFQHIKPLMYGERIIEPDKYKGLKFKLSDVINDFKKNNSISTASVYLRDFEKADWLGINVDEAYHPGSLMKLPVLITYLKESESHPEMLYKTLVLRNIPNNFPNQTFNSKQIEVGKPYTIKELLEYMISYSDNLATYLLNENLNLEDFKKTFVDIHLTIPNVTDRNYTITSKEYSTFFIVLYNAGYLSIDNSEFAMKLMSKCDFTKGFAAGLPTDVPMVHKFGEWSDSKTIHQLHESGIVYIEGRAYIPSVMTSGTDVHELPQVISALSKTVYDNLSTAVPSDNNSNKQTRMLQ
jgi:beta-lactamase class A